MRKAFTLMEVLVLVTVAPLMMVVVSGIFVTFIRDVPRDTRIVQQNTTVLDLLRQVQRDVDGATELPGEFNGTVAGDRVLLIRGSDVVVCYRFEGAGVARTVLKGQGADPNDSRVWRMPNAVMTCRPRVQDGKARAVEIQSHMEVKIAGAIRKSLANSHVFFLQGLGKGCEVQ